MLGASFVNFQAAASELLDLAVSDPIRLNRPYIAAGQIYLCVKECVCIDVKGFSWDHSHAPGPALWPNLHLVTLQRPADRLLERGDTAFR